jgi:hypothetical protein
MYDDILSLDYLNRLQHAKREKRDTSEAGDKKRALSVTPPASTLILLQINERKAREVCVSPSKHKRKDGSS